MNISKKTAYIILGTFLAIFLILQLTEPFYSNKYVLLGVRIFFLALVIVPPMLNYIPSLRKSEWLKTFTQAMLIYYGFLIIFLSLNTKLLPTVETIDENKFALGLTVIALGWALFNQIYSEKKPVSLNINENIVKKINELSKKAERNLKIAGECKDLIEELKKLKNLKQ